MENGYNIAQFGAFDVNSFGDSLFPRVLENELRDRITLESLTLFSPKAVKNGYNGNVVHAYHEFEQLHAQIQFDYIVVGGGELFHFEPISFKNKNGEEQYEKGAMWMQPLRLSKKFNIPVIINGVGVPYVFSDRQRKIIRDLTEKVVYFSVRDHYSYARMQTVVCPDILKVVPDTVWTIDRVYDQQFLLEQRRILAKKYDFILGKSYAVIQYGTSREFEVLIEQMQMMKKKYGWQILVIPVNYSHEDIDVVERVKCEMGNEAVCFTQLLQPAEIISLISGAAIFIGTSLHGNLVAMNYGVRNLAVDMYPTIVSKLDGMFDMINSPEKLILSPSMLQDAIEAAMQSRCNMGEWEITRQQLNKRLREHYQRIAECIKGNSAYTVENVVDDPKGMADYKKIYVWVYDDHKIYRSIARAVYDEYVFEIPCKYEHPVIADLIVEFDRPTEFSCNGGEGITLINQNPNFHLVYMENRVKFKLHGLDKNHNKLKCSVIPQECTELEKQMFDLLKDKESHIDHLVYSEREYERKLTQKAEDMRFALEQEKCEIAKRDVKINNQRGHIEQLLEIDRKYQNIIHSKGWRLVSFPGRMFEKIWPVGTPRRRRISMMYKYVHAFNLTNVKFVCRAWKEGGIKQVRKEIHAFEQRECDEMPVTQPDIYDIEEIVDLSECDMLHFSECDAPKVSIVIPVYNQFTYTYHCLKSILENTGEVSYEILIADDVSDDLTMRLSEIAENIRIIRNKENQMFLRNCNHAAQYARGEYILFLNNDTQVQENWLQPLVDLIERDKTIGMVGSKLIYPDGSLQEAGGIIWGDGHAWNYGNGQNANNPEFNYVKEVDYISGAAIMIRTALWKEIGGFDDRFAPAYCEDSDLAFEVRKHGYKVMYQPTSVVVHFEGKSNGTDTSTGIKSYQVANAKKLAEKWREVFAEQSQTEADVFRARERSQRRKTILVIDHYVPQFDKDAGSKTTWQYLQMFLAKGYNIKFMGDNFFRDDVYTPALEQAGIEVLYGPWYATNYRQWIIDHQDCIDFVYLNRPHITEKYIDFLKEETNIKCIYYGHDLHFLRLFREYELCGDQALLAESEDWKRREFNIMRKSDINYYPSYVEVEEIHKIDAAIPVKAITAYVYEQFREQVPMDFAKRNGIVFVGGFGHPPNEDAVVWFAEQIYPIIRQKQEIPFIVVGSNVTDRVKKLNGNGIEIKGFVTEEELKQLYDTCRLVVIPLRYGAGVKGKVVEALYYGTPMVTTTVGIEGLRGVEEFMEVEDDVEKFAQKVLMLYNNENKWEQTVRDYQKYIRENNGVEAVWNIVREDFQ